MNTPIKREDIRKGDVIRQSVDYTATDNNFPAVLAEGRATYELIERPVQLPTALGVYLPHFYEGDNGITPNIWLLNRNGWIELPNAAGHATKELSIERVEASLGTLVYLGAGSIEQQVNR